MTVVTVSIISTGEMDKLESCLHSIKSQVFDGVIDVTVVCNGPPDNHADVARVFSGAKTIFHETRKGFAENHNVALAGSQADFVLLLNPDVELNATCVADLVAAMQRHPGAGMMGPLLRYPDGTPQPSARRFPRLAGTIVRRTPLRRLFGARMRQARHFLPDPSTDRCVDWLLGACLMLRTTAWRGVGGFDEDFRPLYVEDIDLAWRLWEAGWEVWQSPEAEAIHEHQAATDKVFFSRRTVWHTRGMLRFVRKHPRILYANRPDAPQDLARQS